MARARRIENPWFRCQALALVALHTESAQAQDRAIKEAFASANELTEPNRIVSVSAWPLKALVLLGRSKETATHTQRLLDVIAREDSPVRRADALRLIFGATVSANRAVSSRVIQALVASCLAPLIGDRRNRKGEALLEQCLPGIAKVDSQMAERVLLDMSHSRAERVRRTIAETKDVSIEELISWPNIA